MVLLNFAHPFTPAQIAQLETLTGRRVERMIPVNSQINPQESLLPQVIALVNACGLSADEWQTLPLLVNPPSLNFTAVALIAELHGRIGYFPSVVRLRPAVGRIPQEFEIAEVVDLQKVRDQARRRREGCERL